jgi:hypothetical protein
LTFQRPIGSSDPKSAELVLEISSASRHFDATSASYSQLSHPSVRPYVDATPNKQIPCISSTALQHSSSQRTLLLTPPSDEASENRYPDPRKSHTQGLATLSVVSAPLTLGDLFQPPTLLGYALQSFPPPSWSTSPLNEISPLLRFPIRPSRTLYRRSSGFLPQEKPCPYSPPKGLVWGGTLALLSFTTS